MQTWSAPASQCCWTRARIAPSSPHATRESIKRLVPPPARSSSPTLATPVVDVIFELQIARQRLAGGAVRPGWVGLEHHPDLGAQQFAGAEDRARLRSVLRCGVIGMRAVGEFARQRHHPRPQRCDDGQRLLGRLGRLIGRVPHRLQVSAHRRDRLAVGMAPQTFDHRPMRDADAEQETATRLLGKGALTVCHRHRIACVDVGDPGRHDQPLGVREQPRGVHQRVAPAALGNPQRAVSACFDPLGKGHRLRRAHAVHPGPNAKLAEFHHYRSSANTG